MAFAGAAESAPLDVEVEKGAAGKPKGGGQGRPQILLSGHDECPFDGRGVFLQPTDPVVYQRPFKPDYDSNVFWINLQHPLAEELLKNGEASVQWRSYHFQRLMDVYIKVESRYRFADSENLDVDKVLSEVDEISSHIYADAKNEIYSILFDEKLDLAALEV